MNNNIGLKISLAVAIVVAVVFAGLYFTKSVPLGGFTNEYNVKVFENTVDFNGAVTLDSTVTASSDVRVKSPVETGASSTVVGGGAGVITAAQACDESVLNTTASTTAASTLTLPTAAVMFADCLTTNGDEVSFNVRNLSASTTVITAGTSSTIAIDSGGTVTLGNVGSARITLVRFTNVLMWAFVTVFIP